MFVIDRLDKVTQHPQQTQPDKNSPVPLEAIFFVRSQEKQIPRCAPFDSAQGR